MTPYWMSLIAVIFSQQMMGNIKVKCAGSHSLKIAIGSVKEAKVTKRMNCLRGAQISSRREG